MSSDSYDRQNRGSQSDYDLYYANMDKTMRQKLAFTAAHFLLKPGAIIADMGCGSGLGSYQYASLNPTVNVVGIDINPESIAYARQHYVQPNLRFEIGDIEKPDPALGPFDGILNSSVEHHVLSFNGYDPAHVRNALKNQFDCMSIGGINVTRDFCAWPADQFVFLDVLTQGTGDTPETMSDADLLRLFAERARPLNPELGSGFFLEEANGAAEGFQRFRLSAKWANEFLLRKDYRANWDVEILEEYSWWTPGDFRRELSALNARVLYIAPFWNSWIIKNRYEGKAHLWQENGAPLDFPPTNVIVVAEKIPPEQSVEIREHRTSRAPKTYLSLTSFRHAETGEIYDMASRPGNVTDCLPYMLAEDRLYVAAKHGYPRALANIVPRGTPVIDGKQWSGHMVEPVAIASGETDVRGELARRSGLDERLFDVTQEGLFYYPSPGMLNEKVSSMFVPVQPDHVAPDARHEVALDPALSGFSTSGHMRWYPAQDLLRASQVGLLPEARLELNIYALLRKLDMVPDQTLLEETVRPQHQVDTVHSLDDLLAQTPKQAYVASVENANYLKHFRSVFTEQAKDRRMLAQCEHEFIMPAEISTNAASVIPLALGPNGETCVGLEYRDLPAPQLREGNSSLFVAPAYRLPSSVTTVGEAATFVAEKFGCAVEDVSKLGEGYFSSIGITPERIFPFAVAVDPKKLREPLHFVPLRDLFEGFEKLRDMHLMVGTMRAVHQLEEWPAVRPATQSVAGSDSTPAL